jgi:hypothetical protein
MGQIRLTGRFTVKEGAEGKLSLLYEAGPGPMVFLELGPAATLENALEVAGLINRAVDQLMIDFSYSPQWKLGFGPNLGPGNRGG